MELLHVEPMLHHFFFAQPLVDLHICARTIRSAALSLSLQSCADLWFHTLVMLSHLNLGPNEVLEELKKRFNISGLDEKASRKS